MAPTVERGDAATLARELGELLGDAVSTGNHELRTHATDRSGHEGDGLPSAVVHARTVEDVQAVCRAATAANVPLVIRGAGTGLAGGATASAGEVVLCLEHMNRVLDVSVLDRTAVVEPGVLNGALNARLAESGLWWPPDPASKDISSVGGNIAANAGGLLCAKYGVTREAVLGVDVVLADGSLVSMGHATVKGVTGYDLTGLMVGSEGTLGVIVGATLRLQPLRAGEEVTLAATYPDVAAGVLAAQAVVAAGWRPAIMELLDEPTTATIAAHLGKDPTNGGGAFLLVQCDGPGAAAEADAVEDIIGKGAVSVVRASDHASAEELLGFRRAAFPSMEGLGRLLVEDIAVPRSRMNEAFARIREIETRHGLRIPTTAHAGDGNLHPLFVVQGEDIPDTVWDAASEVFGVALELGGTLTGEHGVGLLKARWLADELGPVQAALQVRVRDAFDPARIFNPGKVIG